MSILKPGLEERYKRVKQSLADDEMRFGREPGSVFLLPVSKTFGINALGKTMFRKGAKKSNTLKSSILTWRLPGTLSGIFSPTKPAL